MKHVDRPTADDWSIIGFIDLYVGAKSSISPVMKFARAQLSDKENINSSIDSDKTTANAFVADLQTVVLGKEKSLADIMAIVNMYRN